MSRSTRSSGVGANNNSCPLLPRDEPLDLATAFGKCTAYLARDDRLVALRRLPADADVLGSASTLSTGTRFIRSGLTTSLTGRATIPV
jgi:hypothetical protein